MIIFCIFFNDTATDNDFSNLLAKKVNNKIDIQVYKIAFDIMNRIKTFSTF